MVIAVHGRLGAGKTVLAHGFAEGLDLLLPITSPTYTLINEYEARIRFFHMDLYRITGEEEAMGLGLEEMFEEGVCLIEWAERAGSILPDVRMELTLQVDPDGSGRTVLVEMPSGWIDRLTFLAKEIQW